MKVTIPIEEQLKKRGMYAPDDPEDVAEEVPYEDHERKLAHVEPDGIIVDEYET